MAKQFTIDMASIPLFLILFIIMTLYAGITWVIDKTNKFHCLNH